MMHHIRFEKDAVDIDERKVSYLSTKSHVAIIHAMTGGVSKLLAAMTISPTTLKPMSLMLASDYSPIRSVLKIIPSCR